MADVDNKIAINPIVILFVLLTFFPRFIVV